MDQLTVDLGESNDNILVVGDTTKLLRNRRLSIYLRDYLKAKIQPNGEIVIPIAEQQIGGLLRGIEDALSEVNISVVRGERIGRAVTDYERAEEEFVSFSHKAKEIWSNEIPPPEFKEFSRVLAEKLPGRRLYDLQLLAAYHLAFAQNAANFSSPGVGKTTIVYGAFAYLNSLPENDPKFVNKILVIGPLSSFGPWESEFQECFSRKPLSYRLSGGVPIEDRKRILYSELPQYRDAELMLTSYQSVPNNLEHLRHFLMRPGNRVMVVLDEAHKIKNSEGGAWADAVLELARFCAARVVLTGTPAPNGYEDLYNLFQFIWPNHDVMKFYVPHLKDMSQNRFDPRIDQLVDNISPFFIRIRKSDLGLTIPIEHEPIIVPMGSRQTRIYKFVEEKYINYFKGTNEQSWVRDTLVRARLIRLMQAATNPALLRAPLDATMLGEDYERSASVFVDDVEILEEIRNYAENETPTKLLAALGLIKKILSEKSENKIVVWCVFIANLFAIRDLLHADGIDSRVLYGGTPTETDDLDSEVETRERIVREFQDPSCKYRVIIANPFAVGESISLHRGCHHAIYVERNFNAAAFLQSKDRIHRYGLPSDVDTHYYYLLSADSVDTTIHNRLMEKEAAMMRVLESRNIPLISLNMDMNEGDENSDIRAIIRDYVNRRSGSTNSR
jgi:SNF2 family DNA or RNA helicase